MVRAKEKKNLFEDPQLLCGLKKGVADVYGNEIRTRIMIYKGVLINFQGL